jgi:hypothetical protein
MGHSERPKFAVSHYIERANIALPLNGKFDHPGKKRGVGES